eukprot:m.241111 g.241111  ORF g.241111 m.241111 type:complete len:83 (-) comp26298_c0_seq8:1037-1285(-)
MPDERLKAGALTSPTLITARDASQTRQGVTNEAQSARTDTCESLAVQSVDGVPVIHANKRRGAYQRMAHTNAQCCAKDSLGG